MKQTPKQASKQSGKLIPLFKLFKYLGLAVLLSTTNLLSGCSDKEQNRHQFSGYIEGRYAQIAAPQSGWLQSLQVSEGDDVTNGQLLFSLDQEQQEIQLAQSDAKKQEAEAKLADVKKAARQPELAQIESLIEGQKAALEYARKEKQRWLKTTAHDYTSKSARDNAVANYDIALAKLEELKHKLEQAKLAAREDQIAANQHLVEQTEYARKNNQWLLSQREVKALNNGNIDQIYYHQGEFVSAGTPVLSILINNEKRVRFFLPQQWLSQIKLKQNINVSYDGAASPIQATIVYIAKDAEFTPPVIYSKDVRQKLVFMIEAELPAESLLLVGQPVDVSI